MKYNPGYMVDLHVNCIFNPAYKGVWEAKKIANPEYKDDDTLGQYADFGFLGFDLWQVKGGTIFDNIIVTDDAAEADAFAKKWQDLKEAEDAAKKAEDAKKAEESAKAEEKDADDDDDDEEKKDKEEM